RYIPARCIEATCPWIKDSKDRFMGQSFEWGTCKTSPEKYGKGLRWFKHELKEGASEPGF
ncbi:MAG: hypothetical protein CMF59_12380, partial [Leptospiraceae bacterium]|nr:hypothetical protein [Leptospiraceae bacterium]